MKCRFLAINKLPVEEAVLLEPPEVSQPEEALFLRGFNPFGSLNDSPGKQFQRKDNCVPSHLQGRMGDLIIVATELEEAPNDHQLFCRLALRAPLFLDCVAVVAYPRLGLVVSIRVAARLRPLSKKHAILEQAASRTVLFPDYRGTSST